MAFCTLLAATLGALMGLRFRIGVVVPVEVAAALAAAACALADRVSAGTALAGFVVFSLALQSGYAAALAWSGPAGRGALEA